MERITSNFYKELDEFKILSELNDELKEATKKVESVRKKINRYTILLNLKKDLIKSGLYYRREEDLLNKYLENLFNVIDYYEEINEDGWVIKDEKTGKVLISEKILNEIEKYHDTKSETIRDVYFELSIYRETDEEGDLVVPEIIIDEFHDRKYSMDKLNSLLFVEDKENLIFERNEENITRFSEDYEDFIDENKEIIIK